MLETFSLLGHGFAVAFSLQNLGAALFGGILGLIVGAMPGIGSLAGCALLLPLTLGVEGVLWTGPVADGLAFLMSLALLLYERHHLKKSHAARLSAQAE